MLSAEDLNCLQEISPSRSKRLFDEFLPIGYSLTTLDTVDEREKVINIKVILGSIITLFDDYADRPDRLNSRLLELFYRLPFEKVAVHDAFLSKEEGIALSLAVSLFEKLFSQMKELHNYHELIELFYFDLKQFFLANQYSEQLTKNAHLVNNLENRLYLHHNMGIVMAGMIDLMSLTTFKMDGIGACREIFLLGQRVGRISNVVTTFEREQREGDMTNEIMSLRKQDSVKKNLNKLEVELNSILRKISSKEDCLNFSVKSYSQGMRKLHQLHLRLKGVI